MKTKLMMMVAAVAVALGVWADTETVDGYTWTYCINGDTATISGEHVYAPDDDYWVSAISPSPTGQVTIPSTLGGKPVTCIEQYAFYDCRGLTSVTIPNSVTAYLVSWTDGGGTSCECDAVVGDDEILLVTEYGETYRLVCDGRASRLYSLCNGQEL